MCAKRHVTDCVKACSSVCAMFAGDLLSREARVWGDRVVHACRSERDMGSLVHQL
jgi:hypothetical protein